MRLLDQGAGEACYNMAVDEVLLSSAEERPTLRLYAWDPPAVSLGYFQPLEPEPAREGRRVVRRITGGGAIVHEDELTFAVAAPPALLGGEGADVRASFAAVNRAIARGLAMLGVEVEGGDERGHGYALEPGREARAARPFLCYERASPTDLRVRGEKLVGSAQRRSGRAVLQHGTIPLGAQLASARRITVSRAAGRRVRYDEAASAVAAGFREALGVELEPGGLTPEEAARAQRLARERYGADPWTARR